MLYQCCQYHCFEKYDSEYLGWFVARGLHNTTDLKIIRLCVKVRRKILEFSYCNRLMPFIGENHDAANALGIRKICR